MAPSDASPPAAPRSELPEKPPGGGNRRSPLPPTTTTTTTPSPLAGFCHGHGCSDASFRKALGDRLAEHPLSKDYPELFDAALDAMVAWKRRFATTSPKLWKRLFDADRVLKEFVEAVPVLEAVRTMVATDERLQRNATQQQQQYTIIDLCSGKGYLGMFLSEMLDPTKVFRIVLMDKAWPMRNTPMQSHHINWDHIYGTYEIKTNEDEGKEKESEDEEKESNEPKMEPKTTVKEELDDSEDDQDPTVDTDTKTEEAPSYRDNKPNHGNARSYYDTWPIPIDTSKQDLKSSRQLERISRHYLSNPEEHPVIVLAVHLCGTLSLRAIDLFHAHETIRFLALKPCCLPGMIHAKRQEVFRMLGTDYAFPATDVCVHGKWKKNKWHKGPPRSHLRPRFARWSGHLYRGLMGTDACELVDDDDDDSNPAAFVRKTRATVRVQHGGGFQNDFLFAERLPVASEAVWDRLRQKQQPPTEPERWRRHDGAPEQQRPQEGEEEEAKDEQQ